MENSQLLVSPQTLTRVFLALLYVLIFVISYRRLVPRLSPTAKLFSGVMLAVQLFVVVVALESKPESYYEFWLWHLDLEWNIPSMLSSTQLAMVGCAALVTARVSRAEPTWLQVYLVAVGVVFLFLGLDEFFAWKESLSNSDWLKSYTALGAAIVLATMIVIMRSPKRERIWLVCLLIGLSLMATGGLFLDSFPEACGDLGFLRIDGCFYIYRTPEEVVEFLGGWLALVAMLGRLFDSMPSSPPRVPYVLAAMPVLWIPMLFLNSPVHNLDIQSPIQPASVAFESNVHLHGFQMNDGGLPSSGFMYLPYDVSLSDLGYSVHLVDQVNGDSIASLDHVAERRSAVWPSGRGYEPVYAQPMQVEVPPHAPVNRALWVVLTVWSRHGDEFRKQAVVSSDRQLLSETQVILGELVLPAEVNALPTVALAKFDNGLTLDGADLPERVHPGDTLSISFAWRSEADANEDLAQFLHFVNRESGEWWGYDQQPLGPRLPTRLWYSGLVDSEFWQVPIPADLTPGRYNVFTGLYRPSDLYRIPVEDAEGTAFVDARVPLGILTIDGEAA